MMKPNTIFMIVIIITILVNSRIIKTSSIYIPKDNLNEYLLYESFFDYTQQNNKQIRKNNQLKMNESIKKCTYTSRETIEYSRLQCSQISFELTNIHDSSANKIFLIDNLKIGLISTSFMLISIYSKSEENKFELLKRNYFSFNEIPYDACVNLKTRHIYIVFAFQNEISKYKLNIDNELIKIDSISDNEFIPSAIDCLNDQIIVNDHSKNKIRVYDFDLILIDIIQLKNVIYGSNNALAADNNIKLFLDGNDGVALFDNNYNIDPNINTCHFYQSKMCVEDIDVYYEQVFKSSIYITNSCTRSIKKYLYNKYKYFMHEWDYMINYGKPSSAIRNSFNNELIVLTHNPNKIHFLNLNQCYDWNDKK